MIESTGNDLVVIADNPTEMVEAQQATIATVAGKLAMARNEEADAVETVLALERANLNTDIAKRMLKRCESRTLYLDKAHQALSAGYVIVPEMPRDVIAIRVNRRPIGQRSESVHRYSPSIHEVAASSLPVGEGEYVDPLPESQRGSYNTKDSEGKPITKYYRETTGEWNTDLALPSEFLKPTVIERTGKMMMRKIFDEIAVIGANGLTASRAKKADPMVIGSVIDKMANRKLWFLVAWFIDTRTI